MGNSVSVVAEDGKTYFGVIKIVAGGKYQIQYYDYDTLYWLTADQFTLNTTGIPSTTLLGKSVSFFGVDGKSYTGVVRESRGNKYRIEYDGYDFESWLDRSQFDLSDASQQEGTDPVDLPSQQVSATDGSKPILSLQDIYDFGQRKGWSSPLYQSKFTTFLQSLSERDQETLLGILQRANTSSARFFALKSLITGDPYDLVQKFIVQLNEYPEAYQQEFCLVTYPRAIIQQWQYSCSVTMLQTYLADLSPRYAWDLKQTPNFDIVTNDLNSVLALQQKQLLEQYGGVASIRGDGSGTSIGIIGPLRDLVTPILGVNFYAQEVTEPLPVIFGKIRTQLDRGINVPILIGFVGTADRHFILAMRYRKTDVGYQYLIYDPWDGKCDYVDESAILQGSLAPLLTEQRISVDYYYPVD
jgi:hypothetical protein